MARPITLFTGQWADLTLDTVAEKAASWGYDGLELACWGDHFDVSKALSDDKYVRTRHDILEKHGLKCWSISNHLVGQAVCDLIDERHKGILSPQIWGDGKPEGVRQRAAAEMQNTARAAAKLGVGVVNGFTGSSVWHMIYSFPPTDQKLIDAGYTDFADRWNPIMDVFDEVGVKFGLEVHPTEIAYDIYTTQRALDAINHRTAFGINFDPSHLYHQFVDSVAFLEEFGDRIYHVHMKDAIRRLDGRHSILASHLSFGDRRRGWDFISLGRGGVDFDQIVRTLNQIGYDGPLSVEWEDSGMHREHGAAEAVAVVKRANISVSTVAFDAAFSRE
jgi:sugar phosphate isomerase/epimerase